MALWLITLKIYIVIQHITNKSFVDDPNHPLFRVAHVPVGFAGGLPVGQKPTVGMAGLTLGGGFGDAEELQVEVVSGAEHRTRAQQPERRAPEGRPPP